MIMATYNEKLESLTLSDIEFVSCRYLMGWHDLHEYGFRIKGLNNKRQLYDLDILTQEMSFDYRINYIKNHFSHDEIKLQISNYLKEHRVSDDRWSGIEIFDCRFGREYARAFKLLLGSYDYRKISEECRVNKLCETQNDIYGGIGLANKSALSKAVFTNLDRYGVENVMRNDEIKQRLADTNLIKYGGKSPFCSYEVREKAMKTKLSVIQSEMVSFKKTGLIDDKIFRQSSYELIVFYELIKRFGKADVYYQYGLHPYDARYPFVCDFYIKSLDLFIELNAHYSHGNHWYDENCHDDYLRKCHLEQSNSHKSKLAVHTWCEIDVNKRSVAKSSNINYLIFWDGTQHQENHKRIPNLSDFYRWLIDYNCDYKSFMIDFPENTY